MIWRLLLLLILFPILLAGSAKAQNCPTTQNLHPSFPVTGGNVFGATSPQWQSYFSSKVDANNGILCNPLIIGSLRSQETVANVGGIYTPNLSSGQNLYIKLVHSGGSACPCTLANPSTSPGVGQTGVIQFVQSSGGSDKITTWGSYYQYSGGTSAITFSTSPNVSDYYGYYVVDTTHILLWLISPAQPQVSPIVPPEVCPGDGVTDCTSAIQAALGNTVNGRLDSLYLSPGVYYITGQLDLADGQCLFGPKSGSAVILVDYHFQPSAKYILGLHDREELSPCVHDLMISATQPNTPTASLSGATITGTTLNATIVSGTPANGNMLYDTGGSPNVLNGQVLSAVNIVGSALTATVAISQTISTPQNMFTAQGRSNALALGSCGPTILCKYPPAIMTVNSNRFQIWNVQLAGTWDGIWNTAGNKAGGWWIGPRIEDGSLNVGLNMFSGFDRSHLIGYHHWTFGDGGALDAVREDGQNYCMKLGADGTVGSPAVSGELDGVAVVDAFCFNSIIQVNNQSTFDVSFTGSTFSDSSTFELTGGTVRMDSPKWTRNNQGAGSNTDCQLTVTGGTANLTNPQFTTRAGSTLGAICESNVGSAPSVSITGGQTVANSLTARIVSVTGNNARFSSVGHYYNTFNAGAGSPFTLPLIDVDVSAGGFAGITFNTNTFDAAPAGGNSCTPSYLNCALRIVGDTPENMVVTNNWNSFLFNAPGNAGMYGPNSGNWWISRNQKLAWIQTDGTEQQYISGPSNGNLVLSPNVGSAVAFAQGKIDLSGISNGGTANSYLCLDGSKIAVVQTAVCH